ncbi:MAG TPA: hypothetical protein VGN20_11150 [Mucilaginibacter sp.]
MTLFNFFKKKPAQAVLDVNGKKGFELISDGILFEPEVFVKWGSDIELGKLYAKKEFRADRTIYHWGERSILNGLTLYFKTICWNHKQHGDIKSFESIDFLSEDKDSEVIFENAKAHFNGIFGEPECQEDVKEGDIALEWKVKAVKISLNLFHKEKKKVHLEIGWWL